LPKGAAYAPSKAALINLAEGLHPELKTKGVTLTIINPGFVATPMTEPNRFPMPFIVSTEYAVEKIRQGLARGKFEIAFPPPTVVWLKTMRLLPYWLYFAISNWVTGQTSKREQPPTASG
jgi:short-subunit dehydrogenase